MNAACRPLPDPWAPLELPRVEAEALRVELRTPCGPPLPEVVVPGDQLAFLILLLGEASSGEAVVDFHLAQLLERRTDRETLAPNMGSRHESEFCAR